MLNKIKLVVLLLCLMSNNYAQTNNTPIRIGDKVPDYTFDNLVNSKSSSVNLSDLKGKPIILEFWATWCGPCIPAMDKLAKLKSKFKGKINVIAVTYDKISRIETYVKNKPSDIIFYSDLKESVKSIFPHSSIPHTVIINSNGELIAETSPDELNENVISQLIKTNTFTGNQKKKTSRGGFDYMADYFPPKNENKRFLLQPPLKNGMAITKLVSKGEYKDRRVTFINSSVLRILKYAYGIVSNEAYELDGVSLSELKSAKYCLDVIVPKGKDIKAFMRTKLNDAFPDIVLSAKNKELEVLKLIKIPGEKINLISSKGSKNTSESKIMRISSYHKSNVTIDDFTNDYLNRFLAPVFKSEIINATNLTGRYDIDFEFAVEDPKSFKTELAKLGLKLVPSKKETEVLVIKNRT